MYEHIKEIVNLNHPIAFAGLALLILGFLFKGVITLKPIESKESAKIINKLLTGIIVLAAIALIIYGIGEIVQMKKSVINNDLSLEELEADKPTQQIESTKQIEPKNDKDFINSDKKQPIKEKKTKNKNAKKHSVLFSYPKEMVGGKLLIDGKPKATTNNRTLRLDLAVSEIFQQFELRYKNKVCLVDAKIETENQQISFINCN